MRGSRAFGRLGPRTAPVLVVALCLSATGGDGRTVKAAMRSAQADRTPPVVRMLSPRRLRAARFVAVRIRDGRSGVGDGTLAINGKHVEVGNLATDARLRFRGRLGWEPRRRYRIRMTVTDRAGNVRKFTRVIRPRRFGIVHIAVRNLVGAESNTARAAGGCGYVHLRPRHMRIGEAPLAVGDSVMLGAAWRLTHAGFETDTRCGRKPRAGVGVLRKRRRRGTLPGIVVVALGTNTPMRYRDIVAMLRALGPRRKLYLATQMRKGRAVGGAAMRRAARRHRRRVALIPWSAVARRHRAWLYDDGTHVRPRGLPGYTRLLHEAVWSGLRGQYVRR